MSPVRFFMMDRRILFSDSERLMVFFSAASVVSAIVDNVRG